MANEVEFKLKITTDGKDTFHELTIDAQSFDEAVRRVTESAHKAADEIQNMAMQNLNWDTLINGVEQFNNGLQSLVGGYDSFDKSMRAANTMAGKTGKDFDALTDSVKGLSQVIPMAREELAGGLYQVISNGVPEDNWISFLEQSSKAAVGGIADLGQTVTVTSTIIKNYGLEWDTAGGIQDKIQKTAKNGVTSFEQLASALPRVSGSASQLGVSIDELMAVFATATGVTGNTAEVSTQLAAVLTALIKPSSEAAKAAEAMGVSFDAASIKEAGGLENFLRTLDIAINEYSTRTGELKETIYGNLFGSAESLRLLTSLTGEQKEKFSRNIQEMADSTGVIDSAFAEMNSTGEANAQVLKNQVSAMTDYVASVVSGYAPQIALIANMSVAAAGGIRFVKTLRMLKGSVLAHIAALKADTAAQGLNSGVIVSSGPLMRIHRMLLASLTAATGSLTAATVALSAAYTMGLSLVIMGIASLFTSTGDAAEEAAQKQDILKESTEAFTSAVTDVKGQIDLEIATLQQLIKNHGDETDMVEELNRKYGESLGYHKTAAEWYDILISKSKAYCQAIGYEAQAKVLSSQKAAKELELESVRNQKQTLEKSGKDKKEVTSVRGGLNPSVTSYTVNTKEYDRLIEQERALEEETGQLQKQFDTCMEKVWTGQEEMKKADGLKVTAEATDLMSMSYQELGTAIEDTEKKLKKLVPTETAEINRLSAYNKQLKARKEAMDKKYGFGGGGKGSGDNTVAANPESYKELSNAIEYYQKQLQNTKPTEKQTISLLTEKISKYKEQQQVIAAQLAAAGRPKELDTLENIDKELTYQKELRSRCTQENLAGIDAEIERLNTLRTTFEEQSHVVKSLDQIQTYQQLADEVAFYERKIQTATETERVEIKKQINALNELREAWDQQLVQVNRPDDISQLNTIEKLSDAVSYYESVQRTQSVQEIEATQRIINALNEKKAAMERLKSIPQMQADTERLDGLGDTELKLELQLIGMDGIKAKIRDLQKMLSDTKNPLDEEQRAEVTKLITSYQEYEKILGKSTLKATEAWGAVKGISNGMQGLTDTLQGNGSAWEKIVSIIDGVIQLYEGFNAIIPIIDMLTGASTKHAAAKGVEAVAETTEAGTNATAAATAVAASAATAAALSVETAAWSALSAAKTFSAHAYIPFAGTAIAAGFIAAQQAIITAAAIPKFANGGIAYGPTFGLFGEYAGASNNPEVVAPLNRLKQLIQPVDGIGGGRVEFTIDGRTLKGVLNKVDNFNSRTR
nr:MAG TPA: minor tail protein [Caudoviricetes sp.]